jgi:ferric-dicitrate binding protein FerR (iron transport regulator)
MPAQSGFKVMEQAAEWYAELRCGEVGLAQQEAWHRWIEADPAHREAWEAVQSISLRFDPLRKLPDRRRAADDLLWRISASDAAPCYAVSVCSPASVPSGRPGA